MLKPVSTKQFERDLKRVKKRRKNMEKYYEVVDLLIVQKQLPASNRAHPLRGEWLGYMDAHIESDWILIYRVVDDELRLARTGSHADLF